MENRGLSLKMSTVHEDIGSIVFLSAVLLIVFTHLSCSVEPGSRVHSNLIAQMALDASREHPNRKAVQKNKDGLDHLAREHWRKAAADFRRAIEVDPTFAVGHYNLGLVLTKIGKIEDARKHIEKAIELNSEHPAFLSFDVVEGRVARDEGALAP